MRSFLPPPIRHGAKVKESLCPVPLVAAGRARCCPSAITAAGRRGRQRRLPVRPSARRPAGSFWCLAEGYTGRKGGRGASARGPARAREQGSVGDAPCRERGGRASDAATRGPSAAASAPADTGTGGQGSRAGGTRLWGDGCRGEEFGRLTPCFGGHLPPLPYCGSVPLPWWLLPPSPPVFTCLVTA